MTSNAEMAAKVRRLEVLVRQLQSHSSVSSLLTLGVFGDGSDGRVNLDGSTDYPFATRAGTTYTLTRDIYALSSLAIVPGVTVVPAGFRFFVRGGTLTNNGTISAAGNDAVASSLVPTNPQGAGAVVGTGDNGFNGAVSSTAATAGIFGGGDGGAGGAGTNAGGGPPAASAVGAATLAVLRDPFPALIGSSGTTTMPGHGGGRGATGGGTTSGSIKGGSSGGGGGMIVIFAQAVINNGYFIAKGGAGGTPAAGPAGGGGGGGGGTVAAYTLKPWTVGSIDVSGGAGGSGFGTGTAGSPGASGTSLNVVLA